jgi:putative heme-binding domain-containing protein
VEFQAAGSAALEIWLNGKGIFQRDRPTSFGADADRVSATLTAGPNRLLVRTTPVKGKVEFQLNFRRKSARADLEQLIKNTLARTGNADRGRKLFLDAEKSLCLKCHRLGEQGEKIGPELTGVGGRFAKVYLVESILEPSRAIAPSFETLAVVLADGRVLTGVKAGETATTLTLADNQAKKHTLNKSDIEQTTRQPTSTMPEGFEKRLNAAEFLDLIQFLTTQRDPPK